MPTYEYECPQCQKQGEYVASISQRNTTPDCSVCGVNTKRVILSAPMGYVDFPAAGGLGYVSPTTGKYIESKRDRIDDLKRSGCRPYEGFESEMRQSKKDAAHEEKKSDAKLDDAVRSAYHALSPEQRAVLD